MPPITLLTDFGTTDTYVGQMKGIIASIASDASIIDLTHHVPPQDVTVGAIMLDSAVDAFPDATVHVAVVDPGVGSDRRPIAARSARFTLVGPDNGLFSAVWQRHPPQHVVALTDRTFHRSQVTATFHGRDIFAPVAAHLATGTTLDALGETIVDPVTLELPEPRRTPAGLEASVLCADHFGNLVTNITAEHLPGEGDVAITVGPARIEGIARTFADVPEGEPVAYLGSTGRLEIALRNASAAAQWSVAPGAAVHVHNAKAPR